MSSSLSTAVSSSIFKLEPSLPIPAPLLAYSSFSRREEKTMDCAHHSSATHRSRGHLKSINRRLRNLNLLLLILAACSIPPASLAQVAAGTPPFGSYSGSPDLIDNGN